MDDAYKRAGVDVEAGNAFVRRITAAVASTSRPGATCKLGGFGGLFDLGAAGLGGPSLVAATDGVGTKLALAVMAQKYDTIGIDLVAMCVNDVLAQGALPLFFLDYMATGSLQPETATKIVEGIAAGCRTANCALIGGETAEMPGFYTAGHFDLAGFCVGALNLGPARPFAIKAGDKLIALPSTGAHANGFSLIRHILMQNAIDPFAPAPFAPHSPLIEQLLCPTAIFTDAIAPLLGQQDFKGMAHITGGGLRDNIPRILPAGLRAAYPDVLTDLPPLFDWLADVGKLRDDEMLSTFNCGIGAVLAVADTALDRLFADLENRGHAPQFFGEIVKDDA